MLLESKVQGSANCRGKEKRGRKPVQSILRMVRAGADVKDKIAACINAHASANPVDPW